MKRDNAIALLEKHGATMEVLSQRRLQATLEGHRLLFSYGRWGDHMITDVTHIPKGCIHEEPCDEEGDRLHNGTKVKRFIEMAKEKEFWTGTFWLKIGPDSTHKKLATSVRVRRPDLCRTFDAVAARMGEAVVEGDMPPEVMLDWLRDQEYLKDH